MKTTHLTMLSIAALLATSAGSVGTAHAEDKSLYNRQSGLGIFHKGRLAVGASSPSNDAVAMDGLSTIEESGASANVYFDVNWLGMPSAYGNWHGLESQIGFRSYHTEFWLQGGTAFTLLNIGRGGPGSFRLGGSFGAGLGDVHAYAYLKARVAAVVIRDRLDFEIVSQWIPSEASSGGDGPGGVEDRTTRLSVWYRYGKGSRAVEIFLERYARERRDVGAPVMGMPLPTDLHNDEIEGFGAGLGITLF